MEGCTEKFGRISKTGSTYYNGSFYQHVQTNSNFGNTMVQTKFGVDMIFFQEFTQKL